MQKHGQNLEIEVSRFLGIINFNSTKSALNMIQIKIKACATSYLNIYICNLNALFHEIAVHGNEFKASYATDTY